MARWNGLRIYIAGPMHGRDGFNYPAFHAAATALRAQGHVVVDPAAIGETYGSPEAVDKDPEMLAELIKDELAYIPRCDAIYLLPGWETSVGARRELMVALALNLRLFVAQIDCPGECRNDTTPRRVGIPRDDFGSRKLPQVARCSAQPTHKQENETMKKTSKAAAKKTVTNVKKSAKTVKNVKKPAKKAVVNKAKNAK